MTRAKPNYAIGVMSGTSVDGIDVALVELQESSSIHLVRGYNHDFPAALRQQILDLMHPGDNEIDRAGKVHKELGLLYAEAIQSLLAQPGMPSAAEISVIGCHGQTVRHRPDQEMAFTLQLGCGATIADQTGINTVTDFRSADMTAGGQGAPFAPFFHHAAFAQTGKHRAIVNLGGIANITLLDGDNKDTVIGFDSGPANGLMDAWIQKHQDLPFDRDGSWAKSGKLDHSLLALLLDEPYLTRKAPKSTGRELFNLSWIESKCALLNMPAKPEDVQHTLGIFTARTIAMQLPETVGEVYVCGGGAENPWLLKAIADACSLPVSTTENLGFPPQWIESIAFAWMADATLNKRRITIPSVTGASHSVVAGAVYFV